MACTIFIGLSIFDKRENALSNCPSNCHQRSGHVSFSATSAPLPSHFSDFIGCSFTCAIKGNVPEALSTRALARAN
ncbi:hypothetical protein LguiA_024771 [Lonicera macranthoides]